MQIAVEPEKKPKLTKCCNGNSDSDSDFSEMMRMLMSFASFISTKICCCVLLAELSLTSMIDLLGQNWAGDEVTQMNSCCR